ncbi:MULTISPECIES: YkgJ family cysteine cluster protein [unclassified Pseudoalteromonas]|uniref:YkgJ family cysteine cluster protein n=1 Tax=unclassified Pseudoalteromonas TaxID=194690 RepID=UPI003014590A
MNIAIKSETNPSVSCSNCKACCCRLEVMIISDTGVPEAFIERDQFGSETMRRLDDGWCAALDRDTFMCTIYENRPWICREFEMGSYECTEQRDAIL